MTAEGMINAFRGDKHGGFPSGLFLTFFFCLFVFLSFQGVYKGAAPPYSTFLSCLKSFIRHPEVFAFSLVFKYCGSLIEAFRGDGLGDDRNIQE